jgi:hypothetical protein
LGFVLPFLLYNKKKNHKKGSLLNHDKKILKNKLLTQKLNYIVEEYIEGGKEELSIKTFGYERQNTVTNLCSKKPKSSTLKKIHMESIERHHRIPMSIWENSLAFDKEKINQLIEEHRAFSSNGTLSFEEEDSIFTKNQKLFNQLKGIWYAYIYPSNPKSAEETEGVWIVETTIHDDYSVVDYWGNAGYLKIGKNQSLIIKEPYENNDLTVIRFSNRHVSFENFRFTIVSNQNGTIDEMVNFGFYSRNKYSPQEAKEILGDMENVQLKLDSNFEKRLREKGVVPN